MSLLLVVLGVLLSAAPSAAAECPRLLDHQYKTLQGGQVDLCDYADRAILVVNTASKCGYTPQFEKLEGLYRKYKDKGLMVVGFPSNDFNQASVGSGRVHCGPRSPRPGRPRPTGGPRGR